MRKKRENLHLFSPDLSRLTVFRAQKQATLLSYMDVFYIMGWLFLFTAPLALFMRKPKSHDRASAHAH